MIYFGTREHMQWVKAPAIGVNADVRGYSSGITTYLSGGAWLRRSFTGAKSYSMTWANAKQADIQPILDYATGVYGTGDIYYCNPFTFETNMLPVWAATPHLAALDAPPLLDVDVRPDAAPQTDQSQGYPTRSAVYTVDTEEVNEFIYIPIPPGYTAWVGVHGEFTGSAAIKIIAGNVTDATPLSVATSTRVIDSVTGVPGVSLALSGSGTAILSGLIVQMLPTGRVPASGGFVGGRGQSGMQFTGLPSLEEYSAALDLISATAELVEVAPWR